MHWPITLLRHVGSICAVFALRALASDQGTGIIDKDGDRAVDVWIWWLLQEIADLFCSFQKKILINQIWPPSCNSKRKSG